MTENFHQLPYNFTSITLSLFLSLSFWFPRIAMTLKSFLFVLQLLCCHKLKAKKKLLYYARTKRQKKAKTEAGDGAEAKVETKAS